jgi:carbonic anhydrase
VQIYVIHHTDCGMVTFNTEQLQGIVKERLGHEDHTHYHEFRWVPSWRQRGAELADGWSWEGVSLQAAEATPLSSSHLSL